MDAIVEAQQTLLVLNPNSRSGGEAIAPAVDRLLELGPLHIYRADSPEAARAAILEYDGQDTRVVIGGGDGTLSSLLEAVLSTGSVLGVLPLGTANDFARSLAVPLDLGAAAEVIAAGYTRAVDVGLVNDKTFLNAVGVGVGPQVTREMDSDSKRQLGVLAYPLALLSVLKDARPFHAAFEVDGREIELDCLQITIGNGIHYGGGMTISTAARLDSGELTVLCIKNQPKWQLATQAISLRDGTAELSEHMHVFSGRKVRLETDVELEASADGELVTRTPLDCISRARALRVFAPRVDADDDAAGSARLRQ